MAGRFTEIVNAQIVSSASPGDMVSVVVNVKNLADYGIYIATVGRYDNTELRFSPESVAVGPGEIYSFPSSFAMPDEDVRITIWTSFWTGEMWVQDDIGYHNVALVAVPPELEPEEEEKFPWTKVLIGAGALVAVVGVASAAKKE